MTQAWQLTDANRETLAALWPDSKSLRYFEQLDWLYCVANDLKQLPAYVVQLGEGSWLPLCVKEGEWQGMDHPHAYWSAAVVGQATAQEWDLSCVGKFKQLTLVRTPEAPALLNKSMIQNEYGPSYFFDVTNMDAWQSPISSSFKRNLRRLRKRALEHGTLETRVVSETEQLPLALERFLTLEASGWKGENDSAILANESTSRFYRQLLNSNTLRVRIHELYLDNTLIASQFALYEDNQINLLKIAFNEEHKDIGPGGLLLEDILEQACQQAEIERLSLVTAPAWADRWKPQTQPLYRTLVFSSRLNPKYMELAAKQVAKKVVQSK